MILSIRCIQHSLSVGLLFVLSMSLCSATIEPENNNTSPELLLDAPNGVSTQALLLDSQIEGSVTGLVASITLKQIFKNPTSEWVNGRYVFPLPETAAVDSMQLITEGRVIRGIVKEKQQAKKEFDAAKKAGKKAGLLQQSRPNLFSMSLANIAPNSEVVAELTWVETIQFQGGVFTLRLPTTLTPRYIPGKVIEPFENIGLIETALKSEEPIEIDTVSGWSQPTDQVPDAPEITPWQVAQSSHPDSHLFSMNIDLKMGIDMKSITSLTHAIDVTQNNQAHSVSLSNEFESLNRDVVIEWTPTESSAPNAAFFVEEQDETQHSLIMIMPPVKNIVQSLPRELIFIIDSSGSMAGVSMEQAKEGLNTALSYLSPLDRFNVIDFDNYARSLFPNPVTATQYNIEKANHFIDRLNPDGGTNMEDALNMAFSQTEIENYLRQIVFITDGSVGNESALFSLIHRRLGNARLFTMGIGSAPNSHFMRGAAQYGRGSFSYIDSLDQAANQMRELFSKINRPVMQDITVDWVGSNKPEIYPRRIPDLYIGEPLMLWVKSDELPKEISIEGKLAGNAWQRTLDTTQSANGDGIAKSWAKRKIEFLESQQVMSGEPIDDVKHDIIKLGVDHQLLTRFTSFIAVEEKPSKPVNAVAKDKSVPNLMPKGNTMAVPVPNTATPATLQLLLGFLMLIGGFCRTLYHRISLLRPALLKSILRSVLRPVEEQ